MLVACGTQRKEYGVFKVASAVHTVNVADFHSRRTLRCGDGGGSRESRDIAFPEASSTTITSMCALARPASKKAPSTFNEGDLWARAGLLGVRFLHQRCG